jgi:hypothetical protein
MNHKVWHLAPLGLPAGVVFVTITSSMFPIFAGKLRQSHESSHMTEKNIWHDDCGNQVLDQTSHQPVLVEGGGGESNTTGCLARG